MLLRFDIIMGDNDVLCMDSGIAISSHGNFRGLKHFDIPLYYQSLVINFLVFLMLQGFWGVFYRII